jgi:ubiquinone/menaquinone biosynthesis C-methylase UbiE
MLAATLRNCRRASLSTPQFVFGSAEVLSDLPAGKFDLALYECILGFVSDKRHAIAECKRVLNPIRSRIGVVDVHYVSSPPREILEQMEKIFLTPVEPLFEADWKQLFSDFDLVYWKTSDLPPIISPTAEEIKQMLINSQLLDEMRWADESIFEVLSQRWAKWEKIFAENRKYLEVHVAIWATPLL